MATQTDTSVQLPVMPSEVSLPPAQLHSFAARWGLELVVLFGSRAKGYATCHSDTDAAVLRTGHEPIPPGQFLELVGALGQDLGLVDLDLVDLAQASPLLQMHVARDGIALYEAHPWAYSRFRVRAFKLYQDAAHDLYRHQGRAIRRGLELLAEARSHREARNSEGGARSVAPRPPAGEQPMSPVDVAMVQRKLQAITERLRLLEPVVGLTLDDYRQDVDRRDATERRLQTLIEAAIDINTHLLVGAGGTAPADYRSSFLDLAGKISAIPRPLATRLAPSAGLRNLLVHEYDRLDDALVLGAVRDALRDYPEYVEAIGRYLAAGAPPPAAHQGKP